MRGRRSSRSAAVVLAGCVGLAVMAPGLALAAPVPSATTEAECETLGYTWVDGVCDDGTGSGSTAVVEDTGSDTSGGSSDAGSGDSGTPAVTPSSPVVSPGGSTPDVTGGGGEQPGGGQQTGGEQTGGQQTGGQQGADDTLVGANPTDQQGNDDAVVDPNAGQDNKAPEGDTAQPNPAPAPKAEDVANVVPDLQKEIDAIVPEAGANPITLPGLPAVIPQPDANGEFENVNDACLNAISKLEFPAGTDQAVLANISGQLQGLCHGLETTDVDVCLEHLRDVLKHLCPTIVEHNTTINIVNWNVTNEWWGAYWTHRYDVDCDELTYDEANAILDWDRSDPFRLDRDDDGEACEWNAHDDEVEYVSYPEGGVSTGDGSTSTGASPAEIALAAGALGGLGATGLVLVRRYAKQG
ncbi:hypothetical protein [Actinomycetospora flava]|uniref:Uncharacterized protein n=1 Tax=Actinomycetospora flava TaxID=3129232 RepID=A0ABU8M264_9PSEU